VSYRIHIGRTAQRQLAGLPRDIRKQLERRIDELAEAPRSPRTKPLAGSLRPMRSLRVGDYRAAYVVDDKARTVRVVWAGHGSRIYEELERKQ
jgi:mRNA interferase RelE/StbE